MNFTAHLLFFFTLFVTNYSKRTNWIILFFIVLVVFTGALRIIPFCLGLLIANLEFRTNLLKVKLVNNKIFLSVLLLIGLYLSSYPLVPDGIIKKSIYSILFIKNSQCLVYYESIGCLLLLFVIIKSTTLRNVLSVRVLALLGKISFGIYLTHLTIIASISVITFNYFYDNNNYYFAVLMAFMVSLLTIIIFASAFYYFIDRNAPIWSSKIARYFFNPKI